MVRLDFFSNSFHEVTFLQTGSTCKNGWWHSKDTSTNLSRPSIFVATISWMKRLEIPTSGGGISRRKWEMETGQTFCIGWIFLFKVGMIISDSMVVFAGEYTDRISMGLVFMYGYLLFITLCIDGWLFSCRYFNTPFHLDIYLVLKILAIKNTISSLWCCFMCWKKCAILRSHFSLLLR